MTVKERIKTGAAFLTLWLFTAGGAAQTGSVGLASPESVAAAAGRYFVSNIGRKLDAEKDGDGFIAEVDRNGKLITRRLLPKTGNLHAPKGMAILGNVLYVTDIDRVMGFDLRTRETVFKADASPAARFLNDLVAVDARTLLATDTFRNKVFRIDLITKRVVELPGTYPGANGLAYDAGQQLVYLTTMGPALDGTGRLYVKSMRDPGAVFTPLPGSPTGMLDGVALAGPQHLLLSDWVGLQGGPGKLYVYDRLRHTFQTLPFTPGSPADFYLDSRASRLLIPQTLTHQLTVVELPDTGQTGRALSPSGGLFHVGVLDAFLGGLYEGHYPYGALKAHGDFGLGAPGELDGEITIYGGSVFQTQHTGRTFQVDDTAKTAYAFVHFFRPGLTLPLTQPLVKKQVEAALDSLLPDANGMYALAIEGTFRVVKTRAFPPVGKKPYPPLVTLLDKQRYFDFARVQGVLVGYRLPPLMGGVNIPGYHFHFLSRDRQGGGHVVSFTIESGTVQIESLRGYTVELPQTEAYKAFDFTKDRSAEIRSVERGEPEKD